MTKLEFLDKINDILVGLNTLESDLLGSLYDELMSSQWISVKKKLPTGQPDENGKTPNYLCLCTGGAYRIANFKDGVWWDCDEDDDDEDDVEWYTVYDITHWMPLPMPPRKEE